jgi:predicted phage terminase large subunit-like protein
MPMWWTCCTPFALALSPRSSMQTTDTEKDTARLQKIADDREKCRKDPLFLASALGYDFQIDTHSEMFAQLLRMDGLKPENPDKKILFDISSVKNRLVLWPRGHFKTSMVVVHVVQLILNYPDIRILLMQANMKLTRGWLSEIKSHFDGRNTKSRLPELFPNFCSTVAPLGTQDKFTVPARKRMHLKEATVTCASPKAVSTGQHYDAFFADDLVHSGNFRNVELLNKLESEFNHFVPLIDPGGYTIVTGTRYHHADLYGRIIARNDGSWMVSQKAARIPDDESGPLLFPRVTLPDGRKVGFTHELLDQIRKDDPEMYAAQYLNQIIAGRDQIFTEQMILSLVRPRDHAEFPVRGLCFFAIDLAWTNKEYSDQSVITVGKIDQQGRLWIVDCVGGKFTAAQLPAVILNLALLHAPTCIFIEKSPGCEFFVEYLNSVATDRGIAVRIEAMKMPKDKGGKYVRIASLRRNMDEKRILFCAGIRDFPALVEEFTQFPKGAHDDRPDCIGLLVSYIRQQWTPSGLTLGPRASRSPWFNYMFADEAKIEAHGMLGDSFAAH